GSGAYDVMQMIFIRSGRWITAGWAEPLNTFTDDAKLTDKAALDMGDFVAGAMAPFKRGDTIYALPWLSDSTVVGFRTDLFEKAGYAKFPETFEALREAAAKIHSRETAGFVTQDNLHWIFPSWPCTATSSTRPRRTNRPPGSSSSGPRAKTRCSGARSTRATWRARAAPCSPTRRCGRSSRGAARTWRRCT